MHTRSVDDDKPWPFIKDLLNCLDIVVTGRMVSLSFNVKWLSSLRCLLLGIEHMADIGLVQRHHPGCHETNQIKQKIR